MSEPTQIGTVAGMPMLLVDPEQEKRVVRLNDLSPDERRLVLALIGAKKSADARRATEPEVRVVEI